MKRLFVLSLLFFLPFLSIGQKPCNFKYLFIGHAYGSQDSTVEQWATLKPNIEKLNNLNVDQYCFLGDIVRDTIIQTLYDYNKIFLELNAPDSYVRGNHDFTNIEDYDINKIMCGPTPCWYDWLYEPVSFPIDTTIIDTVRTTLYNVIYIDTENPNINIDSLIKSTVKYSTSKNFIILSHRLIWAYSNPRYKHLVKLTNSAKMHELPQAVDFDFLNSLKDKKFYFFAGDLGLRIPFFYDKVGNVTVMATGLGGKPDDTALLTEFRADTIIPTLIHLGPETFSISDYTLEKINLMPVPGETKPLQISLKGYRWAWFLGIFGLLAFAFYMVIKRSE